MKSILSAFVAIAFLAATPALAAAPPPPASVTLKAKDGNVTLDHKAHQKQGCKNCHGAGTPGKITLDKDKAHTLCIDCHKQKGGSAPAKCLDCHKKK